MTDEQARTVARGLSKGAANACLAMTDQWQFAGKATFNANGAWALSRAYRGLICQETSVKDGKYWRGQYRLTPLGLAVKAELERGR